MNYDTYDCRLSLSATKAAKALRRKTAKKTRRSARGESRIFAAIRSVTAIAAAWLATTVMAQAQFVIQPLTEATSREAKIYENSTFSNFDSNITVTSVDIGAHFLSLLQFDLSSIPLSSSEVTSATLTLYCTGIGVTGGPTTGGLVTLSPINTPWTELPGDPNGATYDRFFGPSPTLSFGSVVASQNITSEGFVSWDVTNLVKEWLSGSRVNNGVFIQTSGTGVDIGLADVDSAPSVAGSAPKLTVVPEPTSAILAFAGASVFLARRRRQVSA